MGKGKDENKSEEVIKEKKAPEPKLDEFAIDTFESLGIKEPSKLLIKIYADFKKQKDMLQPARLSPDGFVTCLMIANLCEGKYND